MTERLICTWPDETLVEAGICPMTVEVCRAGEPDEAVTVTLGLEPVVVTFSLSGHELTYLQMLLNIARGGACEAARR